MALSQTLWMHVQLQNPVHFIAEPIWPHACWLASDTHISSLFSLSCVLLLLPLWWLYKCTVIQFKRRANHTHIEHEKEMVSTKMNLFVNKLCVHLNIYCTWLFVSHSILHGCTPVALQLCLIILGLTEIVNSDPNPTLSLFSHSVFPG